MSEHSERGRYDPAMEPNMPHDERLYLTPSTYVSRPRVRRWLIVLFVGLSIAIVVLLFFPLGSHPDAHCAAALFGQDTHLWGASTSGIDQTCEHRRIQSLAWAVLLTPFLCISLVGLCTVALPRNR